MAKTKRTRRAKKARKVRKVKKEPKTFLPTFQGLPFSKENYILMLIGLIIGVLGFVLLALGDDNIATIAIVVGYVILIPIALYYDLSKIRKGTPTEQEVASEPQSDSTT